MAEEVANEELSECDSLPIPPLRTTRQVHLLLNGIVTNEILSFVYVEVEVPEALLVFKKRCRYEIAASDRHRYQRAT